MLGFFRRITKSRFGVLITFGILAMIAVAFAVGDVTGLQSGTSATGSGGSLVKVGDAAITPAELRARVQAEMESFRQQQPTLDMATFVAQGGFDGTLDRMIAGIALEEFGRDMGMVVSKKAIDGEIASIPGLQGPNGKFDPALYRRILIDRKLTDAQVRRDVARDIIAQQLTGPAAGATQIPSQLALPYAALLLERRTGQVGIVPISAAANGPAPSDADLQTFYKRGIARYSLPERRVIRYALVTPEQVRAQATPTEAEVAAAYKADARRYAATEKRTITQVVVIDRAGADRLAQAIRGGTPIAAAARAAGLEASTQTGVEKNAYAGLASAAVADAVFAAERGALVGPVRGTLGFVVARVDAIERVPARSLDQVRGEIVAALTAQKTTEAIGAIHDAIDDSVAESATFDEVIADRKLRPATTPALTSQGVDPNNPSARIPPNLQPIVTAGFQATAGEGPQLVNLGTDGSFAVVAIGQVLPAAPRPLAQVRDQVLRDFTADRARQAARRVAAEVVAKVNRGIPLAAALQQTGLSLPAPAPLAASRAEIARARESAQAPLILLFGMAQGRAKLAPSADGSAFAIVKLDRIDRGDATRTPGVVNAARGDLGRLIGREYAEQFARAVRNHVGVTRDTAAITATRAELLGQGQSDN